MSEETPVTPVTPVRRPKARAVNSGDLQGLPEEAADLAAEGQSFEAELIEAVERPDQGEEVKPIEPSEEDVPPEYTDLDPDVPKGG